MRGGGRGERKEEETRTREMKRRGEKGESEEEVGERELKRKGKKKEKTTYSNDGLKGHIHYKPKLAKLIL